MSFSTVNVVADGTVLDGNAHGYVLIQPSILKFNFRDFEVEDIGLVSIAFRDNYEGVFGYVAEPADAVWTPLIFDEDENPISCGALTQNCFFSIGLNDQFGQRNALLSDSIDLCPNNDNSLGWAKIAVSGLDGLENELGIVVHSADQDFGGGAVWMYVE
ncbi:MAG: hypothetical protein IH874_09490 [Candidatus Dadabacteria bacterium]|nr:hypothetical protein [Candidatus Dadabacteria bacterium]